MQKKKAVKFRMWSSIQLAVQEHGHRTLEEIAAETVQVARDSYFAALTQQGRGGDGIAWAAEEYRRLLDGVDWNVVKARAPRLQLLVRKNLAEIESGQGNTEVALQIYCEALIDEENDVTLWFNVGEHALKLRRLRLTRHAFEQALRCNPSHWPSLSKLCCVLSALGDDAACVVTTRRALCVRPDFHLGREIGARALSRCVDASPWTRLVPSAAAAAASPTDSRGLRALLADLERARSEEERDAGADVRRVSALHITAKAPSWLAIGRELIALHARSTTASGAFVDPAVSIVLSIAGESTAESAAGGAAKAPPRERAAPDSPSPAKRPRLDVRHAGMESAALAPGAAPQLDAAASAATTAVAAAATTQQERSPTAETREAKRAKVAAKQARKKRRVSLFYVPFQFVRILLTI